MGPTRAPTPKPSASPTFAPTAEVTTPPLPEYKAEDFAAVLSEEPVVIDTTKAEVKFAVTKEEASTPAMKKSLESGFAAAIGLPDNKVRVSSIDGEAVTSRRLEAAETSIEFEIIAEAATTTKLQENVKKAATSGAVVANVQKAAVDNGVLTKSLKEMERKLPEPAVEEAEITVVVYVQERPPTKNPTNNPTNASQELATFSGAARLGGSSSLVVALATALVALAAC